MSQANENLPEFPLGPYDRLKPRTQTPRAVACVEMDGRHFDLRCEQRIVFFREPLGQYPDCIFAVMPRIEHRDAYNSTAIAAFFRLHYAQGNIARFYVHHFDGGFEREFPLFFGADGSGVCREFYNEDDLPFSWQAREVWEGDEPSHIPWQHSVENLSAAELREIVSVQIIGQLEQLQFGPLRSKVGEIEFLCGSVEELERLVRLICQAHQQIFGDREAVELIFASEHKYTRAHLFGLHWLEPFELWDFELDDNERLVPPSWEEDQKSPPFSEATERLFALALDYNTPAGVYWEYHDCGSGRASNSPHSNLLKFTFQKPTTDQSRAARDELRAWLTGKVPAAEIEELVIS